jgi:hypothetical protein
VANALPEPTKRPVPGRRLEANAAEVV